MPNSRSSCLAVVPDPGEVSKLFAALDGTEHARAVATGDEVRTLEPLLRGDD